MIQYGDDQFVLWSHVVDRPLVWGTRIEVKTWLQEEEVVRHARAMNAVNAQFPGDPDYPGRTVPKALIFQGATGANGVLPCERLGAFLASHDGVGGYDTSLLDDYRRT